jgi:hypothetical protein
MPFLHLLRLVSTLLVAVVIVSAAAAGAQADALSRFSGAWPETDLTRVGVPVDEIISGGVRRDGIPSIDDPKFIAVSELKALEPQDPVLSVVIGGKARAYPLDVMIWHEIVNDELAGVPIAVTYCPLCNSAVVFDRRVGGRTLEFGVSGMLRNSDMIMYDRQTFSWWQQFTGTGIVGTEMGTELKILPARLESWALFSARHPDGEVLVPHDVGQRDYGINPYHRYDSSAWPFLYRGKAPEGIAPLARVVAVGNQAWSLDLLQARTRIEDGDLVLAWSPGQASALDTFTISEGRDVGNVTVQRRNADGSLEDAVHDVTFAFTFVAFNPDGTLHLQ